MSEKQKVSDADRAFELWFFRDIVDEQRRKLIALTLGKGVAEEATNHGLQRICLRRILAQAAAQERAEIVALADRYIHGFHVHVPPRNREAQAIAAFRDAVKRLEHKEPKP